MSRSRDVAGKRVAVEIGGYEFRQITSINEEQVKSGLKPIEIQTFSTFADAFQALRAGQVDAVVSVDVNAKYYQDRGDFERAISGLRGSPATLAFRNKEVGMAVLKVLNVYAKRRHLRQVHGQVGRRQDASGQAAGVEGARPAVGYGC